MVNFLFVAWDQVWQVKSRLGLILVSIVSLCSSSRILIEIES